MQSSTKGRVAVWLANGCQCQNQWAGLQSLALPRNYKLGLNGVGKRKMQVKRLYMCISLMLFANYTAYV